MMAGRVAGALALVLTLLAPGALQAEAPVGGPDGLAVAPGRFDNAPAKLAYQVYFGGLKALALDVEIDLSSALYRVRLSAHTEGLIDWVVDWTAQSTSEGSIAGGALRPARHSTESVLRGSRREVRLTYHQDGSIDAAVEPPVETDEREPVTAEQARGAFDPVSAVLIAAREVAVQGSCDQRVKVFDGRRRYDLAFSDGGRQDLKPTEYGSFSGPATLCLFRYIRIAGFQKPGGRWSNPRDEDRIYRVWLAPIVAGLPPLPVRIEAEGTFGDLIVHLVEAGRRAG
jgi:hypothetical protein